MTWLIINVALTYFLVRGKKKVKQKSLAQEHPLQNLFGDILLKLKMMDGSILNLSNLNFCQKIRHFDLHLPRN
jgi:hypothetical protein